MKSPLRAGVIACAAALVPLPLLAPAAARAQAAPWTVVPSPDAGAGNNVLDAVASIAAGDVWAVGSSETATGADQPLTEHWDGTAWSIVAAPGVLGGLSAVAAASSTDVWAGGSIVVSTKGATDQFLHWNGRRWTAVKSPATAGATILAMAAVTSSDVWAVGSVTTPAGAAQTFTAHWNGKSWAVVPSPDASAQSNLLTGVTAISATDVWAVGHALVGGVFTTLAEHWDGTAWSIIPSPSPTAGAGSELNAAAAVSSTDVWAVGDSGPGTLIEQWNGTTWTVVSSPSPAGTLANLLLGAAVVSASDIWAVGEAQNPNGVPATLIEQWNGTSWSIVASPSPGGSATLSAASADPVSGQAWAAGNSTAGPGTAGGQQTLTEFNP